MYIQLVVKIRSASQLRLEIEVQENLYLDKRPCSKKERKRTFTEHIVEYFSFSSLRFAITLSPSIYCVVVVWLISSESALTIVPIMTERLRHHTWHLLSANTPNNQNPLQIRFPKSIAMDLFRMKDEMLLCSSLKKNDMENSYCLKEKQRCASQETVALSMYNVTTCHLIGFQ